MRQFSRFQYKLRDNLILLNYTKNLQHYSFLQTQFDQLHEVNNKKMIGGVSKFVQKMTKHQPLLLKVQKHDFNQMDLRGILNKTTNTDNQTTPIKHNQSSTLTQYQPLLTQLALLYQQMQQSIYDNLSKNNLRGSIEALTSYNCMDIKIWQKVISFVTAHYKTSPLKDRLLFIKSISQYMKKFEFSSSAQKRSAFKFMYPQSYILDLIDFRSFFKAVQNQDDFIKEKDSEQDENVKLQLFQNMVYLIMKATKKADMNIYSVRKIFQKRMKEMALIASRHKNSELHKKQLYSIYFICSYLNMNQPEWYQQIEKHYYASFKETMMANIQQKSPLQSVSIQSKQMNKLLSVWKLNGRASQQIYETSIKPFIKFLIKNDLQLNYFSNICLNLITAGIKDHQTIIELVQKCDQKAIKQDELLHMVKHYINVVDKYSKYQSDYHACKQIQNPQIVKYFNDRNVKMRDQSGREKNKRSFQYRKVEKLWSEVVKKLFEPKYQVIENAVFCNYEIDFLILTKKFPLAIEIEGGHYNKKQFNKGSTDTKIGVINKLAANNTTNEQVGTTGKKQMRQVILRAYGIRSVKIHCEEKQSTYVMQSRNSQLCTKFITQKIYQQTGLSVNDF